MTLVRHTTTVLIFLAASNLLGVLASAVVARRVGPAVVGMLAIGLLLLEFATILENWSTSGHVRRAAGADEGDLPGLFTTHLLLKLTLGLLAAGGIVLAADPVGRALEVDPEILTLFALVLPFAAGASAVHNTLEARGNMVGRGILDAATAATYLAYAWFLVETGTDAVLGRVAAAALTLAIALAFYLPGLGRPRRDTAEDYLSFGLRTAPSALLMKTIFWADTALIAWYLTPADAGIYQVAYSVGFILVVAASSISTALYPELSRGALAEGWEAFRESYRQGFMLVVLVIGASALALVLAAPLLIPLLFGDAFLASVAILQLLAVSFLLDALGTPSALALTAEGRPGVVTAVQGAMAAVNLGGNLLLIPLHGVLGAVAMTFVTFGLGSLLEVLLARRLLDLEPPASLEDYRAFVLQAMEDLQNLGPLGPKGP